MISSNINFNVKFNHDLKNWLFISYLSFSKKKKKKSYLKYVKLKYIYCSTITKLSQEVIIFFFLKQNYQE